MEGDKEKGKREEKVEVTRGREKLEEKERRGREGDKAKGSRQGEMKETR